MRFRSLPNSSYYLFPWRAAKFIIYSMLKNPNNHTHNKNRQPCNTPHPQCKWLQECQRICVMLFYRSQDNQARLNEGLGEINNFSSAHCNFDIPYCCIKILQDKVTLITTIHDEMWRRKKNACPHLHCPQPSVQVGHNEDF